MYLWWFLCTVLLARSADACVRSKDADHGEIQSVVRLECPRDIVQVASGRSTRANVSWNETHFHVESTLPIKSVYQTVPVYGASTKVQRGFEEGRHVVTYKAVDERGAQATCSFHVTVRVVRCQQLYNPQFGMLTCEAENLLHSQCHSTCIPGYSLVGQRNIACGLDGQWSHDKPFCRITTCPDPGTPLQGSRTCDTPTHQYGSQCVFSCMPGYHLVGSSSLLCLVSGWSRPTPQCQEVRPPRVEVCPGDIELASGKAFTRVEKPAIQFRTSSNAVAPYTCTHFNVGGYHNFSIGVHSVMCSAWDPAYGEDASVRCQFTVKIKANPCRALAQPMNGFLMCSRFLGGAAAQETSCKLFCNRGYVPARTDYEHHREYVCDHTGNWQPSHHVPSCVQPIRPRELMLPSEVFYTTNNCSNAGHLDEVKSRFHTRLQTLVRQESGCLKSPGDCLVENVITQCRHNITLGRRHLQSRRRRKLMLRRELNDPNHSSRFPTSTRNRRDLSNSSFLMPILFHLATKLPATGGEWPDEYHKARKRLFGMFDFFERKLLDGSFTIRDDITVLRIEEVSNSLTHAEKTAVCDIGYIFSKSMLLCVPCGAGTYFDYVTTRCVLCEAGKYQNMAAMYECITCPEGTTTPTEGATNLTHCVDIDECESNPCLHNGHCVNTVGSFICRCQPGHTGKYCGEAIYDCTSHSCLHGATCIPEGRDNHSCLCRPGYTGYFCQFPSVDGNWGDWSAWSTCSKSCEVGEQKRRRVCDSPVPSYGGSTCTGEPMGMTVCNQHPCPTCKRLRRPYQGEIDCARDEENDLEICRVSCLPGYAFTAPVYEVYTCGRNTTYLWPHETLDNPRCVIPGCVEVTAAEAIDYRFRTSSDIRCTTSNSGRIRREVWKRAREATARLACIRDGQCQMAEPVIRGCPHKRRRRRRKRRRRKRDVDESGIIIEVKVTYTGKRGQGLSFYALNPSEKKNVSDELEALGKKLMEQTEQGTLFLEVDGHRSFFLPNNTETSNSLVCPFGTVPVEDSYCVKCQPGWRYDGSTKSCRSCEEGHYQPAAGQSTCIRCPVGQTTMGRAAQSSSECYESGTTSRDGKERNRSAMLDEGGDTLLVGVALVILVGVVTTASVIFLWRQRRRRELALIEKSSRLWCDQQAGDVGQSARHSTPRQTNQLIQNALVSQDTHFWAKT